MERIVLWKWYEIKSQRQSFHYTTDQVIFSTHTVICGVDPDYRSLERKIEKTVLGPWHQHTNRILSQESIFLTGRIKFTLVL